MNKLTLDNKTEKERIFQDNVKNRLKYEKLIETWQYKLYSINAVEYDVLKESSKYLNPKAYEEVILERKAMDLCGYPLCDKSPMKLKGNVKLDFKNKRLLDAAEFAPYCSYVCYAASKYFMTQLLVDPIYFRNLEKFKTNEVVPLGVALKDFIHSQQFQQQKSKINPTKRYIGNILQGLNSIKINPNKLELKIIDKDQLNFDKKQFSFQNGSYDSIEGYQAQVIKVKDIDGKIKIDINSAEPAKNIMRLDINQNNVNDKIIETAEENKEIEEDSEDDDDPNWYMKPERMEKPKLRPFGKIWMLFQDALTPTSKKYFEYLKQQDLSTTPLSTFNNQLIIKDKIILARQEIICKQILEQWKFITREFNLVLSFHNEIINFIKTLNPQRAEFTVLNTNEAFYLGLIILKKLKSCLSCLDYIKHDHINQVSNRFGFHEQLLNHLYDLL